MITVLKRIQFMIVLAFISMLDIATHAQEFERDTANLPNGAIGLLEPEKDIAAIRLSPDQRVLAIVTDDKVVNFYDTQTHQNIATLDQWSNNEQASSIQPPIFSPYGPFFVIVVRRNIYLYSTKTYRQIAPLSIPETRVRGIIFSSDGATFASVLLDNTIRLWSITGHQMGVLEGHTESITSVVFSPDGDTLVSWSRNGVIRLWSVREGVEISTLFADSDYSVSDVSFPDASDTFWVIQTKTGDRSASSALLFRPGSITSRGWTGRSDWFRAKYASLAHVLEDRSTVVVISQARSTLHSDPYHIMLWSLKEHGEIVAFDWSYNKFNISPDGNLFAATDGSDIRVWSVSDGRQVAYLKGHTEPVTILAFSPDNDTLASGSDDRTVRLWSVSKQFPIVALRGHSNPVRDAFFLLMDMHSSQRIKQKALSLSVKTALSLVIRL